MKDDIYTCDKCKKVFDNETTNSKIKEKIKTELPVEPKRKWWKFYLLPYGTPKQIATKGLIITLVGGIVSIVLLRGSIIGDICDIINAYGGLLLLTALIIWIKNKIQKKKVSKYERKN